MAMDCLLQCLSVCMLARSKKAAPTLVDPLPAVAAADGSSPTATQPAGPERLRKRRCIRRSSDLCPAIPVAVFRRLVREVGDTIRSDLRWEADALEALQVDAEAFLIGRFGQADKRRELCKFGTLRKAHFAVQ